MDKIELSATSRDVLGKKVRFLRRQGLTPANLYGHKIKSVALQIDTVELKHTLARAGKSSLIALKLDGTKRAKMVIVRDVQREPVSGDLIHVDLFQVKMEEKVKLAVPLVLVGEAPAARDRGGIMVQNMSAVEVECLPANMPQRIEVDLTVLQEIDQAIHVKDLSFDENVSVLTDPEQAIVQIARSKVEVEVAEGIAAAEVAGEKPEAAEGAGEASD